MLIVPRSYITLIQTKTMGSVDGLLMLVWSAAISDDGSGIFSAFIPPGCSNLYRLQYTRVSNSLYIEARDLQSVLKVLDTAHHSGYLWNINPIAKAEF